MVTCSPFVIVGAMASEGCVDLRHAKDMVTARTARKSKRVLFIGELSRSRRKL